MAREEGSTKYERVRTEIERRIRSGQYTQRVPPIRELAAEFGVNTRTVMKAMEGLIEQGLLVSEVGRGTFVNAVPRNVMVFANFYFGREYHPFYSEFFDAMTRHFAAIGYRSSYQIIDDTELETDPGCIARSLDEKRCQGAVLVHATPRELAALMDRRIPTGVFRYEPVDGPAFERGPTVGVTLDHEKGCRDAVEYLIKLGHRRIAVMDYPESRVTPVAMEVMRRYGIEPVEDFMVNLGVLQMHFHEAYHMMKALWQMDPRPTAVYINDDFICQTALLYVAESEIRVPDELSIVSHRNRLFEFRFPVPITHMELDGRLTGQVMAQSVADLIEGREVQKRISLKPHLVIRQSTRELPAR